MSGDPRTETPGASLTCPSPSCRAWNPLDADDCVECGTSLGLKPKEDQ